MGKYTNTSEYVMENGVLKNKFNINDEDKLTTVEKTIVFLQIAQLYSFERFEISKKYFLKLHRYLFADIYDFAGKLRTTKIAKDNTMFCQPIYIEEQLLKLFDELILEKPSNAFEIAKTIGKYYADINFIHPFREGNGRTNRLFFELYANHFGYVINFDILSEEKLLQATIKTTTSDESELVDLLYSIIQEK